MSFIDPAHRFIEIMHFFLEFFEFRQRGLDRRRPFPSFVHTVLNIRSNREHFVEASVELAVIRRESLFRVQPIVIL